MYLAVCLSSKQYCQRAFKYYETDRRRLLYCRKRFGTSRRWEILGTRQSGFTQFKLADMSCHQDLLLRARDDVQNILKNDFRLETPRGQALKVLLYLFEQNEAVKTYLAGLAFWIKGYN